MTELKLTKVCLEDVEQERGTIFVPNTIGVLQPAASLCYNDCPWITETASMNFTHPEITFQTSECLGKEYRKFTNREFFLRNPQLCCIYSILLVTIINIMNVKLQKNAIRKGPHSVYRTEAVFCNFHWPDALTGTNS